MFEGVLYFILGFLAAALIALMISPAIWNRAVILTKRRIESSVPLTLNEVQADKDQLRAEFAMSTRRLEMSIEELQEKAASQVIEINRKRDELAALGDESRKKVHMVEELEARSAELRTKLSEREELLEKTAAELEATREKLDQRSHELEGLLSKIDKFQADADSRRIEMAANQTTLLDVSDQAHHFEEERDALRQEVESLRDTNNKLESELTGANERLKDAQERLERITSLNTQLERQVQQDERQLSTKRASKHAKDDADSELTRLLMEERKRTNQLEADLAKTTLHMEAILNDASNENVSKAIAVLSKEKEYLRSQLKTATKERNELEQVVKRAEARSDADWEDERKENAVLRERLNDLAARVTAMTAAMEGPDSPINEIWKKAEPKTKQATPSGQSLADRIRALQEVARVKQTG